MKKLIPICSVLVIFFWTFYSVQAQDLQNFPVSLGLQVGVPFYGEKITEFNQARYKPTLIIGKIVLPIKRHEHKTNFAYFLEPQFNFGTGVFSDEIEYGLGHGFRFSILLNDQNVLFSELGSGLHYLSLQSGWQASGFIFSDFLSLGYLRRISIGESRLEFKIEGRARHLSNAGLKEPNLGLDNLYVVTGVSILLPGNKSSRQKAD